MYLLLVLIDLLLKVVDEIYFILYFKD